MKIRCDVEFNLADIEPLVISIVEKSVDSVIKQLSVKTGSYLEERVISRREMMQLYKISSTTLYNHMKSGLPHIRLGRRIYFNEGEVNNYLKVDK